MFLELDQKKVDRVTVTLEWDPDTGHVQVRCETDGTPGESFCFQVDPREAALAFEHPFATRAAGIDRERSDDSHDPWPRSVQSRWRRWLRPRREARTEDADWDYGWSWWLN